MTLSVSTNRLIIVGKRSNLENQMRLFVWKQKVKKAKKLWVLTIFMPNRPVRDHWKYPRKMGRHFPIKPGQPKGMALTIFIPFPNSLIRAKNRFVKNGTTNFGRNISTGQSGPPPVVIPNIPVGRNRNEPHVSI